MKKVLGKLGFIFKNTNTKFFVSRKNDSCKYNTSLDNLGERSCFDITDQFSILENNVWMTDGEGSPMYRCNFKNVPFKKKSYKIPNEIK